MSESINIGRTIARERRRAGVTQEALAAHLGVSKAAVSKWELGQSLPDVSLLPRIAGYFSLTLDELFDWHDALSQEESAALYAEVYALGEKDLGAAHKRLRACLGALLGREPAAHAGGTPHGLGGRHGHAVCSGGREGGCARCPA